MRRKLMDINDCQFRNSVTDIDRMREATGMEQFRLLLQRMMNFRTPLLRFACVVVVVVVVVVLVCLHVFLV
jgi:hypothetical protein